MKNIVFAVLVLLLLFSAAGCSSGHYVSAQVGVGAYPRPVRPYANSVWVGDNYYWRGGRYMYRPGYWAQPRVGFSYLPGGWVNTPRGYYWRRGGWAR